MFFRRSTKPKIVVCTICSGTKDRQPLLMPARRRYLGEHVRQVESVARFKPLFFLSGVMGLIPADTSIPYYDHLLHAGEVDALAERVARQVRHYKIDVLEYYQRTDDPSWAPYSNALRKGAFAAHAGIIHMALPAPQAAAHALPHAAGAPALA